MTETDELPQLLDDPRGKLDVAADLVDVALEKSPANALPSSAMSHVALAVEHVDDDIEDKVWELAVTTTDRALRERGGDA